jgi:hypothetical protein
MLLPELTTTDTMQHKPTCFVRACARMLQDLSCLQCQDPQGNYGPLQRITTNTRKTCVGCCTNWMHPGYPPPLQSKCKLNPHHIHTVPYMTLSLGLDPHPNAHPLSLSS